MARFLARIFALTLAVAVLVVGVVLLAQIRPVSAGGWVLMAIGAAFVLVGPFLIYRGVMSQVRETPLPNEGEGAGLAMGAGIDTARSRETDGDVLDFD
jgi:hypothetical protein